MMPFSAARRPSQNLPWREPLAGLLPAVLLTVLLAVLLAVQGLAAQDVPDFATVAGHRFGERVTVHAEMVRYLETLAEVSERVAVVDQGASWEGRRLLLAIVTAPANHARLDALRDGAQQLGDPRGLDAATLDRLIAEQPAVVWLGGSIHGFELSGSEGLLKLLEHLTLGDDAVTRRVLDETVVLIDPMLNPDGRDAFAHFNHQRIGRQPNPLAADWSNATSSWQGLQFRTGHYFFDTNRDWFAHTQRETRHRVGTLVAWRPQVVIDAHEMGPDTEFYFDPATEPWGQYYPPFAQGWMERFNAAYAAAFDAAGFHYTTRQLFNFYYPGYTTSYNSYQGAVGMLYEQGSSRGLALERGDRSVRRLADALEQQYTAAWTAVRTAAEERETLLRQFADVHRRAVSDIGDGPARYRIVSGADQDPLHLRELVALLLRNGIEVGALDGGGYVVEAAQPRQRLVRVLLERNLELPSSFLAEARQRLDRGENPRFYDMTAWSLPLLFNLEVEATDEPLKATPLEEPPSLEPVTTDTPTAGGEVYAYLLDGRAAATVAIVHALRQRGHRVGITLDRMRLGEAELASGTGVVWAKGNDVAGEGGAVADAVRELARRHGVGLREVASGLGAKDGGIPALGSPDVLDLRPAAVAILAEMPVHGYSFGWAWYTLDRQYEVPTTVLPVRTVAGTPLHPFQSLVIPDLLDVAGLAAELGEEGLERLRRWVRDGGNLVALGAAVDFVREHLELTSLTTWYAENAPGPDGPEPRRFEVPGAIFQAELDLETWLSAGYSRPELPFLINSDRLLLPPDAPPDAGRRAVARLASGSAGLISGHAWPESLERLPGAVLAWDERVGRGRVIAFAEDLNYRAYWRGANRLFLNAVLLGPSAR